MELNIIIDNYSMNLNIPDEYLTSSEEAFSSLDNTLDRGCQIGRDWVQSPDTHQRCQFAAGKLLTAIETDNESLAMISAGYIVNRLPGVQRVRIDTSGEMNNTTFE